MCRVAQRWIELVGSASGMRHGPPDDDADVVRAASVERVLRNQIRVDNLDAFVDRGDEEVILVLARTFPA